MAVPGAVNESQALGDLIKPTLAPREIQIDDLLREFVAGGDGMLLAGLKRSLGQWIDDVTKDFGSDLYERMMRDSDVSSALDILKLAVLSDGVKVQPSHTPPSKAERNPDPAAVADAKRAQEIADFVTRQITNIENGTIDTVCKELLDGLALGYKAAEIVVDLATEGEDKGKYTLRALKTRKRKNMAFVVDQYNNVLGFLAIQPGKPATAIGAQQQMLMNPEQHPNFVPRWKFVVFTHDQKDEDPRGTSLLRAAYNSWFLKTQVFPEYYNYLRRFGSGSIIGKTPPNAEAFTAATDASGTRVVDADGRTVTRTAQQVLLSSLMQFISGVALAVPHGTEVELIESDGDGKAFLDGLDYFGRQIHQAILRTARGTKEAKNASQSDTGTAQDIVGLVVAFIKGHLSAVLSRDLFRFLVKINFPPEDMKYCPTASLMRAEQQDKAELLAAYTSAFTAGMIHHSSLPGIYEECGIPEPDWDEWESERAQEAELAVQAAGMQNDIRNPGTDGEPPVKED